jgi:hypothetical protein
MTLSIFWKEWREQGFVILTLLVAGCGLLGGAAVLLDPPSGDNVTYLRNMWFGGRLALLLMTMATGLVVGATLFAGERESGTFTFLDMLPGSRWSRWWRKTVIGTVLMLIPVVAFAMTGFALGILGGGVTAFGWLLFVLVLAMIAFGWGSFGSVFGKTSMAACGIGLAGAGVAVVVAFIASSIVVALNREVFHAVEYERGTEIGISLLVSLFTVFFLPLGLSAFCFTAPDRGRHLRSMDIHVPKVGEVQRRAVRKVGGFSPFRFVSGIRRLVWLSRRQFWLQMIVTCLLALITGCVLLIPELSAAMVYPIPCLIVGVVAGVALWNDEQTGQSLRFWSERRLPTGRLWRMKTVSGFALLFPSLIVLLFPIVIRASFSETSRTPFTGRMFQSAVVVDSSFPILQYLVVWGMYGLAFGSLFGMLFRKGIVAGAVALMVSAAMAGVWFPSFLMGGVESWQWFVPLLFTFLLGRTLVWAAATDRLSASGPIWRMVFGFVAILLSTSGGLAYRAFSVESVKERDDDLKFAASIPSFDLEQPGRDLRRVYPAIEDIANNAQTRPIPVLFPEEYREQFGAAGGGATFPRIPILPGMPGGEAGFAQNPDAIEGESPMTQLLAVLRRGMPKNRKDFEQWLESVCTKKDDAFAEVEPAEWERLLAVAATKAVGVFDDPTEVLITTLFRYVGKLEPVFRLYFVRGLQLQQKGQPEEFVKRFEVTFKLTQTIRNKTFLQTARSATTIEAEAMLALDRWLENLNGRPDLLARVLEILKARDELSDAVGLDDHLAWQTVTRNCFKAPNQWLPGYWGNFLQREVPNSSALEMDSNAYSFAVLVPWEAERLARIIGQGNSPTALKGSKYDGSLPAGALFFDRSMPFLGRGFPQDILTKTIRTAAILKVAIRMHEARTTKMPTKLSELVDAKILTAIPKDPYDPSNDFRYRLSAGEKIENFDESLRGSFPARAGVAGMGGMPGGAVERANNSLLLFEPACALLGAAAGVEEFNWDPDIDAGIVKQLRAILEKRKVTIQKNQGILWSIGMGSGPNNGTVNVLDEQYRPDGGAGDYVFIVPRPAEMKR